jgi:SSS family solute:Na+ symporter
MRSLFGVVVSFVLGVGLTFTSPRAASPPAVGLTMASLAEGEARFKGGIPSNRRRARSKHLRLRIDKSAGDELHLPGEVMEDLDIDPGNRVYLVDARWWLGGFRSLHAHAVEGDGLEDEVLMSPEMVRRGGLRVKRPVVVETLP